MTLDKVTVGYAFDTTYPKTQKTASTEKNETGNNHNESAFESVGPTAPESVKNAWMQAAEETGVNGYVKPYIPNAGYANAKTYEWSSKLQ